MFYAFCDFEIMHVCLLKYYILPSYTPFVRMSHFNTKQVSPSYGISKTLKAYALRFSALIVVGVGYPLPS